MRERATKVIVRAATKAETYAAEIEHIQKYGVGDCCSIGRAAKELVDAGILVAGVDFEEIEEDDDDLPL